MLLIKEDISLASAEGSLNPPVPVERRAWACWWGYVSRSSGHPSWKTTVPPLRPVDPGFSHMPLRPVVCSSFFDGQRCIESPFEVASPLPERFDDDVGEAA